MSAGSTIDAPRPASSRRSRLLDERVGAVALAEQLLARNADARALQARRRRGLSCSRRAALRAAPAVALSRGIDAGHRRRAESPRRATVRVIGPAVSWLWAMGMMPVRLTRPSVGLMPTRPQLLDGDTIEPSVSVPTATVARAGRDGGAGAGARARRVAIERVRIPALAAARRSSRSSSASSGSSPTRSGSSCRG